MKKKTQKPNKEGSWRIIETTYYGRDGLRTEDNSYSRKGMYDNERSFQTQLKSKKTQAKSYSRPPWNNDVRLTELKSKKTQAKSYSRPPWNNDVRLTVQTFDGTHWVTLEIWESWKYRAEEDSEA